MRYSTMMRWTGLAGAMALLAACSDAPTTAPAFSAASADVAYAKGGKSDGKGKGNEQEPIEEKETFTIVPGQPFEADFGNFTLKVDANALCDMNSGYGREYWDQDCKVETKPMTFVATWTVEDGAGAISFNKDVRFHPKKRVTLSVKATGLWRNTDALLWYEGNGSKGAWVDEGTYDREMKTVRKGKTLSRRLKHFSGYNVGVGVNCDPMVESCDDGIGISLGF